MSRNNLAAEELLSWARREGDAVLVGLWLPSAELVPGQVEVRLSRANNEMRVEAEVTSESDAVALAFRVPQAALGPAAWSIAVRTNADDRYQPIAARLLDAKGQPVAVLTGPVPDTKMPPPAPRTSRTSRTPSTPGPALPPPAATPSRRAMRRGRALAGRTVRTAPRAVRKVSGGRGNDLPAGQGDGQPERRPDGPAPRLKGPALRALRAAGEHPVVVLTDPSTEQAVAAWLPQLPGADVTILRLSTSSSPSATAAALVDVSGLGDVERRLFPIGRPAALVVAMTPTSVEALAVDHRQLLKRLFPHVRLGGVYVAYDVPNGDLASDAAQDDAFGAFRSALTGPAKAGRTPRGTSNPRADGVREVVERPDFVLLRKNRNHALHLSEEQVGDLLETREPGTEVSILEVRPAGTLHVAATEIPHGPRRGETWPDRLGYPEMTLRHYRGDFTSMGSMLLTTDSTILPESFRWVHTSRPASPKVRAAGPNFSWVPRIKDAPLLEGDYYFLDCLHSGHFGHLVTEVVCRLWGWDAARRELPALKALFHTNPRRHRDGTLERKIFSAYGVPEAEIVATDRPVRVRSVVGASPMWHNAPPFYVHPDIRETWARLSFGLLDGRPPAKHEQIFVSRGDDLGRRPCRNQAEVERFFADRGFHVFYPERLPLDEQVALFAGARMVAGFAGSAMFNMMHCRRLESAILISHNGYDARNENLFTSVLGGVLHYFWQESDVPLTGGAGSQEMRRASYAFDFEKYGEELAQVINEP